MIYCFHTFSFVDERAAERSVAGRHTLNRARQSWDSPKNQRFGSGIVSDNYSFLDQNDEDLSVKGNGGVRQMHNYVSLNDSMNMTMHLPTDDTEYKTDKLKDGEMSVEALQRKRDQDLTNIKYT